MGRCRLLPAKFSHKARHVPPAQNRRSFGSTWKCQIFHNIGFGCRLLAGQSSRRLNRENCLITHGGLYEFRVMPFGLTNAPAVFQRLMQQVLQGLNPTEGPSFVSVYIDDVLIFSRSLEEHLRHIGQVLDQLQAAGQKLKPSKCHFVCQQVEYLGHLITPKGLPSDHTEGASSQPQESQCRN